MKVINRTTKNRDLESHATTGLICSLTTRHYVNAKRRMTAVGLWGFVVLRVSCESAMRAGFLHLQFVLLIGLE